MQITSQRVRSLYSPAIIVAWVWDGPGAFSKWPINFPTFHTLWVASLIQHRPLCHFDFYGACAYLALVPPPNLVPKWGEEFSQSNYLAGFWHQWVPYPLIFPALCALSLRTSPLLPSWPVGRTPQSLDRLSIGNNLRENSNSYSYPNNKLLQRKETFFLSFPKDMLREGGREGEREGEKHQLVASHTPPEWGPNPQPRHVPWPRNRSHDPSVYRMSIPTSSFHLQGAFPNFFLPHLFILSKLFQSCSILWE